MARPPGSLIARFETAYGRSPDVFRAPGRINLIGEHTDYNGGFVLPVAIELACYAASAPNRDGKLRVTTLNLEQTREWPVNALTNLRAGRDWSDYVVGTARELSLSRGYDLMIESTVPLGSSLSSSAALEIATALALGWTGALPSLDLVKLGQRVENDYLGIPTGIMDQYASVFGRAGQAIKIDCRDLSHEYVSLPAEAHWLAINSNVKHEIGNSAYGVRVQECRQACREMGVATLRDAAPGDLDRISDPVIRRRARHVLSENQRVLEFIGCCARNDLPALGRLMRESHASLRADYEVSCAEIDYLVEKTLLWPGVFGARMTGGGFGGCIVALLEPAAEAALREDLSRSYSEKYGIELDFYPVRPSMGAQRIS